MKPVSLNPDAIQSLIDQLADETVHDFKAQAAVNDTIASLTRLKKFCGGAVAAHVGGASPTATNEQTKPETTDRRDVKSTMNPDHPFYGLGLREAARKQLELSRKPLLPREIFDAIKETGFVSAHHDPVHATLSALNRRAKTHKDVLPVGEGRWGLVSWYTEMELEDIERRRGGMPGRDTALHRELTRQGMQNAISRGARPGKRLAMTAEQWLTICRMLDSGASVAKASEAVGLFPSNYYYHRKRGTFDGWKEGDPWPPQNSRGDGAEPQPDKAAEARRKLRVVGD